MTSNHSQDDKQTTTDNKDAAVKPDSETLHTTDPQEHMEGPISSLMHKAEEGFDSNESEDEPEKETDK